MNSLLRPQIWPSFRVSSGVGPCDVPFRYASGPIPRQRGTVARWQGHLCGLVTPIHETSGLRSELCKHMKLVWFLGPFLYPQS